MIRKLKPNDGCCLYFPHRKKGSQIVTGKRVWVRLGEEWKHIKLGLYTVQIPEGSDSELVPTSEDLWCKVNAIFSIHVGGYADEGREMRLALATDTCPATNKIKEVITLDFFKNWTTGYCKSSIREEIKNSSFVKLIESTEYRTGVVKAIQGNLKAKLEKIGLILIESTVVIEPQEPEGSLISKEVYEKWQSIRDIRDAADIIEQQAEYKTKEQEEKLKHEHEEYKKNLAAEERKLERDRNVKEEDEKLEKEKVILSYRKTIKDLNHQSQLYDLQLKEKYEEEEDNKNERAEDRKRRSREKALQQRLDFIEKELEEKKKQIQFNELAKKSAVLETEVEKVKGLVSAEIIEKKSMANFASKIAMQKSLLDALPKVLAEANRPIEKMGEIRTINITGLSDKKDNQSPIGSILASATFLPLLKEVIHFISNWESNREQPLNKVKEEKSKKS